MNRYYMIHRLRWPAILLLTGVIALLDEARILSWGRAWPLYLILFGVLALAERAIAAQPQPPAAYPYTDPYGTPGYPPAGYPPPGYGVPGGYPASAPGYSNVPPAGTAPAGTSETGIVRSSGSSGNLNITNSPLGTNREEEER